MKSGFKSTEFWLHILGFLGSALFAGLSHSENPTIMIAVQAAAAIYTASRTYLKAQQPTDAVGKPAAPVAVPALPVVAPAPASETVATPVAS